MGTTQDIQDTLAAAAQAGDRLNTALATAQNEEDAARHSYDLARQRRIQAEADLKALQVAEKKASDDLGNASIRRRDWQEKIASFSSQIEKMHEIAREIKTTASRE